MKVPFVKLQGLGNDFFVVDLRGNAAVGSAPYQSSPYYPPQSNSSPNSSDEPTKSLHKPIHEPTPDDAVRYCDRARGMTVITPYGPITGADGILLIKPVTSTNGAAGAITHSAANSDPTANSTVGVNPSAHPTSHSNAGVAPAYARMEILNADGSTAEMCGNGIRVVALYLRTYDHDCPRQMVIETLAGPIGVTDRGIQHSREAMLGAVSDFEVDMGIPRIGPIAGESIESGTHAFRFIEVDMGNPHAVIFADGMDGQGGFADLDALDLRRVGEPIENHRRFANRTNVEFVQVESREHLRVRVWERGSGETLACGTGACASAVVGILRGDVSSPVRVNLPGGDLEIAWAGTSELGPGAQFPVLMTGPAEVSGVGEFLD